ncbi:hypothetical protein INR49_005537 [Caranx melampygus]|nr:hypothetical protein INR49_005537 [Caranx melampygus]
MNSPAVSTASGPKKKEKKKRRRKKRRTSCESVRDLMSRSSRNLQKHLSVQNSMMKPEVGASGMGA